MVAALTLAACGGDETAQQEDANVSAQGSYGASSGPNLNEQTVQPGAAQSPAYDDPAAAAGSSFGRPSEPANSGPADARASPPTQP